jgi:hypothetical protein
MSSLSQWVDFLGTNPLLGVASFIIAIIGIVLAVIFYLKSKKIKSPYYAIRSINLIKDLISKIESLEMLFRGKPIKNLTVTKIAFWNAGNDTINYQDIPHTEPLTINVKEGIEILDAKVLYAKNPANQFSISTSDDNSLIKLQFEYIDNDEGAVIQIIHTGVSEEDIDIHGTIKGVGKPIKKSVPHMVMFYNPTNRQISFRYLVGIMFFGMPLLFIYNIYTGRSYKIDELIGVVLMTLLYWGLGYYFIKRRVPKGFDIFEEEF